MTQIEKPIIENIFLATEKLMANDGLHSLSIHKIAREANISPGTIYIHFKNKDELLRRFSYRIFSLFSQALEKDFDENLSFFEQYRHMWWNVWRFLQENPMIVTNISQYNSLPGICDAYVEYKSKGCWQLFCQNARRAGELCDFSAELLFSLGLKTAINLASDKLISRQELSDEVLENIIERTWRSIQKQF